MITQEEVNLYLDGLRETGKVNMTGAAVDVMGEFKVSMSVALLMWKEWVRTFGERHCKECKTNLRLLNSELCGRCDRHETAKGLASL